MKSPRLWASLDAFVEGGAVLGRKVANTTFLDALLRANPYDEYHFFLSDPSSSENLDLWVRAHFPLLTARGAVKIFERHALQARMASEQYHCMHLSDALTHYAQLAQIRNAFARNIFPITGLTHSLSYARFMSEYLKLLWSGVSARDAVIVTSESARSVLEHAFAALRRDYGLPENAFPAPGLARIPLGVAGASLPAPCERWDAADPPTTAGPGRAMRELLGLSDEPVFLCLSRFSHYSKMDLMPLFAAFRRAEGLGLPRGGYALVLTGWADEGDPLPEALRDYAGSMGIRTRVLVRPTGEERRALYAAADIFVSPSDNIQETFGLTVAEAAMASLPAIVSDFDGYRDIVVHGETGLLVPVLGFAESGETDVQSQLWFDNQYHLKLAQQTAVNVPCLARSLCRLGLDADQRRRMGEAARTRALALYSWDRVIERYVSLWDELAAAPLPPESETRLREARHPQIMRFAELFSWHFSTTLHQDSLATMTVQRTPAGEAVYRGRLPLIQYAGMEYLLNGEAVRRMLLSARRPKAAAFLLQELQEFFSRLLPPAFARDRASFTLLWALKQDFLEILGPDNGENS